MFEYVLQALLITEAAELLAAAVMGIRSFYDFRLVLLVNLMTNPLVSAIYLVGGVFLGRRLIFLLAAAELLVWILEAWVYKNCMDKKGSPFLLSAVANTASILAGYVVGKYF